MVSNSPKVSNFHRLSSNLTGSSVTSCRLVPDSGTSSDLGECLDMGTKSTSMHKLKLWKRILCKLVQCFEKLYRFYNPPQEKEKITPVLSYRRDFEPVGLILITVFRDAVCGFMPPLGGGL